MSSIDMMDCDDDTTHAEDIIEFDTMLATRNHSSPEEYTNVLEPKKAKIPKVQIKQLFIWIHSWGFLNIPCVEDFKLKRSDVISALTANLANYADASEEYRRVFEMVMNFIENTKSELNLTSSMCTEKITLSFKNGIGGEKMFEEWTYDETQRMFNDVVKFLYGCISFEKQWAEQFPIVNADLMILYIFTICQINMSTYLQETIINKKSVSIHMLTMMIVDILMDKVSTTVWIERACSKVKNIMDSWYQFSKLHTQHKGGYPTDEFYNEVKEFINTRQLANYRLEMFLINASLPIKTRVLNNMESFFARLKIENYSKKVYDVIKKYIEEHQFKDGGNNYITYEEGLILNLLGIENLINDIETVCKRENNGDILPGIGTAVKSLQTSFRRPT